MTKILVKSLVNNLIVRLIISLLHLSYFPLLRNLVFIFSTNSFKSDWKVLLCSLIISNWLHSSSTNRLFSLLTMNRFNYFLLVKSLVKNIIVRLIISLLHLSYFPLLQNLVLLILTRYFLMFTVAHMCQFPVKRVDMMYIIKTLQ
jgi:hypothetical protein